MVQGGGEGERGGLSENSKGEFLHSFSLNEMSNRLNIIEKNKTKQWSLFLKAAKQTGSDCYKLLCSQVLGLINIRTSCTLPISHYSPIGLLTNPKKYNTGMEVGFHLNKEQQCDAHEYPCAE